MAGREKYFLVQERVLPVVLRKTVRAKEILRSGEARTVNEAVQVAGISRGSFYKYRHAIFSFGEASRGKIMTIALILEHTSGVLSEVLKEIAKSEGNILTINQGLPLQGVANASISFETAELLVEVDELLNSLAQVPGVRKLELVGHN